MKKGNSIIVGIAFVIFAIYFAVASFSSFAQQLNERDWIITTATVTDEKEREEYNGHSRNTVFDIDFEYSAGDESYTGSIKGSTYSKRVGNTIEIKYNPKSPSDCADILKPSVRTLIFNLILCCIFAYMGLYNTGNYIIDKRL